MTEESRAKIFSLIEQVEATIRRAPYFDEADQLHRIECPCKDCDDNAALARLIQAAEKAKEVLRER